MAIEKKLICFARLEEFERQLAAGNILDYSIVFIQDAKKIWNRGTYYDCSGEYYAEVYGDTYVGTSVEGTEVYLTTNVAENLDAVSARGQLADALDIKNFVADSIPSKVSQLENDAEYITHEDVAAVAVTGSYNDLTDKPSIPNDDSVKRWGYVKGVKLNGSTKTPSVSDGIVDLGTIEGGSGSVTDVQINGTSVVNNGVATIRKATVALYGVTKLSTSVSSTSNETVPTSGTIKKVYDLANGKQDALESGTNIKTINGESILGSGNITISGGGVSEDYVNTAIANAITTTLNTAV